MRSRHARPQDFPGTVAHRGLGLCSTHYIARWNKEHPPIREPWDPQARRRALVEDVEWLISCGEAFDQVCRRLGKTPVNLERTLYRAGRADLVHALKVAA